MDCIRCKRSFDSFLGPCPDCAWNPDDTLDSMAGYHLGDRVLDRYEIVESLGIGRLGTVLRVIDMEVGLEVALKILHPGVLPDRAMQDAFIDGLQAQTKNKHEGMARLFDVGRDTFGRCFYISQLLDGVPLRRLMENRGARGQVFSIDETLPVIEQISDLLSLEGGRVHGAISPEKVWILPRHLKMSDLGVTLHLPPGAVGHRLQRGGRSRAYVAPELATGGKPDTRADVYALGVLIGEMTTQVVFRGGAQGYEELLPDLPVAVQEVLVCALQPGRATRYRNADELFSALANSVSNARRDPAGLRMNTDVGRPSFWTVQEDGTGKDTVKTITDEYGEESDDYDEIIEQAEKTAQISMDEIIEKHESTQSDEGESETEPDLDDLLDIDTSPRAAPTPEPNKPLIEPRRPALAPRSRPPGPAAPMKQTLDGIGPRDRVSLDGAPGLDTEPREATAQIATEDIEMVESTDVRVIVKSLEDQAQTATRESTQELIRRADKLDGVDPRFVRAAHSLESDRRSSHSKQAAEILSHRPEDLEGIDPRLLRAAARLEQAKHAEQSNDEETYDLDDSEVTLLED